MSAKHPIRANSEHNLSGAFHALAMLIDDQPIVANAVHRALAQQHDIDFHYCSNPHDAVAVANRITPTVILLDLVMPQINGLDLLKILRANPPTSQTPIVVLSVREEPETKKDAFALGANDYLVKLPDAIELRARVRYHSKTQIVRLQREDAMRALSESQKQLFEQNTRLLTANQDLQNTLAQINQLHRLLPICACCKKVRDDQNYWHQIDSFLSSHSNLVFSQGLCPKCSSDNSETSST